MTEWWQQTIKNTKQKHSSIYMGNTIIQEMNPLKIQPCKETLHEYVTSSNILYMYALCLSLYHYP